MRLIGTRRAVPGHDAMERDFGEFLGLLVCENGVRMRGACVVRSGFDDAGLVVIKLEPFSG